MAKDVVFIDTNLFIEENYFNQGNRIQALLSLAKAGTISLISTEIVHKEVEFHYINDMKEAFDTLKECKTLKNIKSYYNTVVSLNKKEVIRVANESLKAFFDSPFIFVIGYSYCDNVEDIFNKYFNKEKPFGEGKKKDEFPDAFTLQALENYCKKSGLKEIVILSNDKDVTKYSSKYFRVEIPREYVTAKLKEKEELDNLKKELQLNKNTFTNDIKDELLTELDENNLYYESIGYSEISNINIVINRFNLNEDKFDISSITDDYIYLSIYPSVSYKITVNYQDLDYGYYDKEDGVWYGEEWRDKIFSDTVNIKIEMQYDKVNEELSITDIDYSGITENLI